MNHILDLDLSCRSVGFDLRLHADMVVQCPSQPFVACRYEAPDGATVVRGSPERVVYALQQAGYRACVDYTHEEIELQDLLSLEAVESIVSGGILEMVDPNDNAGARHQYRVCDWLLLRRRLPALSVGDRWADDDADEPWWEPIITAPQPGGPLHRYWVALASGVRLHEYASLARLTAGHVAAYTPNGREVRYAGQGYELQPPRDNYWIRARTLAEARRIYVRGLK